jgi:DNA polymerase III subunit epsilon
MRILGLDFETTGLLPSEDRIIEVGAVLWDWERGLPVTMLSNLVSADAPLPQEITQLTGITDELLSEFGLPEQSVMRDLESLIARADFIMAHNGNGFDKPFYEATCKRLGYQPADALWLDTRVDIRYPESISVRNLTHLAAEHGFLNPFAHRAVFDVLTMLRLASNYKIEDIVARARENTVFVRALVSFDDKEKAKARGYYWCGPQRIWWRPFKESDYTEEKETCGFPTALLQKSPE